MTIALGCCILIMAASSFYIFSGHGRVYLGPEETRASYLRERKDAVYEKAYQAEEGALGLAFPLFPQRTHWRSSHAAFVLIVITLTMSRVIFSASTSSTRCMKVRSNDECSMLF